MRAIIPLTKDERRMTKDESQISKSADQQVGEWRSGEWRIDASTHRRISEGWAGRG